MTEKEKKDLFNEIFNQIDPSQLENLADDVKFLKNSCEFQIKRLIEKCEDIISKQNYKIEQLKKQNEIVKKRLNKVKNIF